MPFEQDFELVKISIQHMNTINSIHFHFSKLNLIPIEIAPQGKEGMNYPSLEQQNLLVFQIMCDGKLV
jgi:hypothetical protein